MVIPCFECGDDVFVNDDSEIETALCQVCISSFEYSEFAASYSDYESSYYGGLADYDDYQFSEMK